jgi:hypothetical protein
MIGKGLFSTLSGAGFKTFGSGALEGGIAGGLSATGWGIGPGDLSWGGVATGTAAGTLFGALGAGGGIVGRSAAKDWASRGRRGASHRWVGGNKQVGGIRIGAAGRNMTYRRDSWDIPKESREGMVSSIAEATKAKGSKLTSKEQAGIFNQFGSLKRGKTRKMSYDSMPTVGARVGGGIGGLVGLGFGNSQFGNSRKRKHMTSLNHYGETF